MTDAAARHARAVADDGAAGPAVTVIIATYNRSYTLRHAIRSVLDSTFTDVEVLVIGDACTDDTAACVAAFDDTRIRFVNLPQRCGDQSGPNNLGVSLARGRYLAFLNHDDLFLPDHIDFCVTALDTTDADLVLASCALALPHQRSATDTLPCRFSLSGVSVDGKYSPFAFYFASSWMLRRSLSARIGPWTRPEASLVPPSQDWLFRAWRGGARMHALARVSVIAIPAAYRPGCYRDRSSPEHDHIVAELARDPAFRTRMVEAAAIEEARVALALRRFDLLGNLRRLCLAPLYHLLAGCGVHPLALKRVLVFDRRGGEVRAHRRTVGAD